jgi:hypothetical protein
MLSPTSWKCPSCGATVTLPSGPRKTTDRNEMSGSDRRLDQVARAVCGCWVRGLSDDELGRFVLELTKGSRRPL